MCQQDIQFIVTKAQEGNQEAREEILRRFHPLLIHHIQKYFGINQDTDDWVQEGRLILLKALEEYEKELKVPFSAYAKKQVFYYYVNERKKIQEKLVLDQTIGEEDTSYKDLLASQAAPIEEQLMDREAQNALKAAMDTLSPKQREVIYGYYIEGKKLKDLAQKRKVSYQSIVKLKARALTQLGREVEKPYRSV